MTGIPATFAAGMRLLRYAPFLPSNRETSMSPTAKKATKKTAGRRTETFTAEERAAMKARAQELKAEAKANRSRAEGEHDVLAKISALAEPDRALAKKVHEIVTANAPSLMPKTWYGMPAYARDGKVVCFFQDAGKFGSRYATLGFNDSAKLDDGNLWPTSFALKKMTAAEAERIAALVKKAVG